MTWDWDQAFWHWPTHFFYPECFGSLGILLIQDTLCHSWTSSMLWYCVLFLVLHFYVYKNRADVIFQKKKIIVLSYLSKEQSPRKLWCHYLFIRSTEWPMVWSDVPWPLSSCLISLEVALNSGYQLYLPLPLCHKCSSCSHIQSGCLNIWIICAVFVTGTPSCLKVVL